MLRRYLGYPASCSIGPRVSADAAASAFRIIFMADPGGPGCLSISALPQL